MQKLREVPSVPLLESAPQQYLLFGLTSGNSTTSEFANGHSSTATGTIVLAGEDSAGPTVETIDSLVRPLVESAKSAPPIDVSLPAAPEPSQALRVDVGPRAARPLEASRPMLVKPAPFLPHEVQLIELPTPVARPAQNAPPAEPINPGRAEPRSVVELPVVTPAPFSPTPRAPENLAGAQTRVRSNVVTVDAPVEAAREIEKTAPPNARFVELAVPAALPPHTAPPVESVDLASAPPLKPVLFLPPVAKYAELAAPVAQPPKIAPAIQSLKPAGAVPPVLAEPSCAGPAPFATTAAQTPELAHLVVRTVGIAPPSKSPNPIAVELRSSIARPAAEASPFTAPSVDLPELTPAAEPLSASIELASRAAAIAKALEVHAAGILVEITAQIEVRDAAIRAIAATFEEKPAFFLLPAPREIVAVPAPPDFAWKIMPRPTFTPRKPPFLKFASLIAPPQKLPLAGPCLPAELLNFIEETGAAPARGRGRVGLPAWMVSVVVATSLFLGAGTLLQRLSANREAKQPTVAQVARPPADTRPSAPTFEPHPFARFVEVTGLRVVADLDHRSQVQYIVVNHSSSELTGMAIHIVVRSSKDPADAAPLFTVSAIVPSLGPHQSKEIRTDLDSDLRASALPEWEYLRTDVQVGTQN